MSGLNVRRWMPALALAVVLLVGCGAAPAATPTRTPPPEGVRVIDPPFTVRDFTMTDHLGAERRLSDLSDRLALITFGFTHCPDICPANLANFKLVQNALGDDAERVAFVFVSVDGTRDTPEVMARHLALFDPEFIGLTADEGTARVAAQDFGVTFSREELPGSEAGYTVNHTASSFLVDHALGLMRIYAYGIDFQIIAADIRAILDAEASGG